MDSLKNKEISGLFEISMDEGENDNLEKQNESNLIELSSKLKSKQIKHKTPKRLKTSLNEDIDDEDEGLYEFTPDKDKVKKKLSKSSTKKSSNKVLKSIDNKNQSRKRPLYKIIKSDVNDENGIDKDEMERLAKEYEEISNYKLIVE